MKTRNVHKYVLLNDPNSVEIALSAMNANGWTLLSTLPVIGIEQGNSVTVGICLFFEKASG
jgi:hypothetical protein